MGWVVFVLSAGLLMVLRRYSKPSWLWIPIAVLAMFAGAAFARTWGGDWLSTAMRWVFTFVGGWFGIGAGIIAGVIAVLMVVAAGFDIFADRKADTVALVCLFLLPILVLIASGPVAATVDRVYDNVYQGGVSSVGRLAGG